MRNQRDTFDVDYWARSGGWTCLDVSDIVIVSYGKVVRCESGTVRRSCEILAVDFRSVHINVEEGIRLRRLSLCRGLVDGLRIANNVNSTREGVALV